MKSLLSVCAGALYSLAYVAPSPYWLYALVGSLLLVIGMRLI